MPFIVATYVYASSQGQRTHSVFGPKTYHLIASQVKSSPDPWIKKPEDGGADEAEAGEQEVDKEV